MGKLNPETGIHFLSENLLLIYVATKVLLARQQVRGLEKRGTGKVRVQIKSPDIEHFARRRRCRRPHREPSSAK